MKRFIKVDTSIPRTKRKRRNRKQQLKYKPLKQEFKPYKPRRRKQDDRIRKGRIKLSDDYVKKGRQGGHGRPKGSKGGNRKPVGNRKGNPQNLVRKGNPKNLKRRGNIDNLNRKGRPPGIIEKKPRKKYKKRKKSDKKIKRKGGKGNVKNLNRKGRPKGAKDKKPRKKYERKSKTNKKSAKRDKTSTKKKGAKKGTKNVIKKPGGTIATKGNRIGRRQSQEKWKPDKINEGEANLKPINSAKDILEHWDYIQSVLAGFNALDYWNDFTSLKPEYRGWVIRVMNTIGVDMEPEKFIDLLMRIDASSKKERVELLKEFAKNKTDNWENYYDMYKSTQKALKSKTVKEFVLYAKKGKK